MNVHVLPGNGGYSVEWYENGRSGRDYESTIFGTVARVSQLLRGEPEKDTTKTPPPPITSYAVTASGQRKVIEADDAMTTSGGGLMLTLNNKVMAVFAPGTWTRAERS